LPGGCDNASVSGTGRVAAVVVTHNRKGLLAETLRGLAAQSRPVDLVVVVDNASSDGTTRELHRLGWIGQEPSGSDGDWLWRGTAGEVGAGLAVVYLRRALNDGGAAGFAAGTRMAIESGCDWLWLLDDDVEPAGDALAVLLEDGRRDPGLMLQQRRVFPDGSDAERYPTALNLSNPFGGLFCGGVAGDGDESLAPIASATFEGLFFARELVERIGLPDPSFFLYADDTDFAIRASRAGFRLALARRSRLAKKLRAEPTPEYSRKHYFYFRNLNRVDIRYGSWGVRHLRPLRLTLRRIGGCLLRRASAESLKIVVRSYLDARAAERGASGGWPETPGATVGRGQ
jgi:GT2 family glycosyltransferase